mmetsp:Transcript_32095/g.82188  ORF Transcript_32095/g.82188 Transcript_32095/m.82188 type:complete len:147 (+) Transcript_32095:368-808(+)
MDMMRACRLVVDTGLHALGWARTRAVAYMAEHCAQPLHEIEAEVTRYIAWPGQATAYKIGELEIRRLRKLVAAAAAEASADVDFALKECVVSQLKLLPSDAVNAISTAAYVHCHHAGTHNESALMWFPRCCVPGFTVPALTMGLSP